ncbi:MAG: hypothetical protein JNL97_14290 [Verrucomicrobiales bacterium]|nr:hypothetical protein [Verrucomicrobiales bacterium]
MTVSDLFSTAPGKLLATERGTDVLYEIDLTEATDLSPLELANGRLVSDPSRTLEQLNAAGLLALGVRPVAKSVVLSGLTSISPLLEKVEGVCVSGGRCVFTYDNDFNVAEAASLPQAPLPGGPRVQLELVGDLQPKLFVVPR